jgi:hypothetical protein
MIRGPFCSRTSCAAHATPQRRSQHQGRRVVGHEEQRSDRRLHWRRRSPADGVDGECGQENVYAHRQADRGGAFSKIPGSSPAAGANDNGAVEIEVLNCRALPDTRSAPTLPWNPTTTHTSWTRSTCLKPFTSDCSCPSARSPRRRIISHGRCRREARPAMASRDRREATPIPIVANDARGVAVVT